MSSFYLDYIDERATDLDALADYIWEHPELNFKEYKSCEYFINQARKDGFRVTEGVDGFDTAFTASFGRGRPIIAMLGEYDALDGLYHEAGSCEAAPTDKPGHGCGHNLLGMGAYAAALAVKKYLEKNPGKGTVIFFGCPAEEGGSSKAFMARDGVFDNIDLAYCWHPQDRMCVQGGSNLANCRVVFHFDGVSAHAAITPHKGRSALDALELMNIGVQFLREHMDQEARVHYAITDAGGIDPATVQNHAEAVYLIRAPKNDMVKELYERVCRIAQGAALMTDTKESHRYIKAVSNIVPNPVIVQSLFEKTQELQAPKPSEEELPFFREMAEKGLGITDPEILANPVWSTPYDYIERFHAKGSTDVSDVSQVCPTAQIMGCCYVKGTPGHCWQRTAQGKTNFARNMARYVGKLLAASAVEFIEKPELVKAAADEYKKAFPEGYSCMMPPETKPGAK